MTSERLFLLLGMSAFMFRGPDGTVYSKQVWDLRESAAVNPEIAGLKDRQASG